jgi:hypothetical protein
LPCWCAGALEIINLVSAGSAVKAGVRKTVVLVDLALGALVSSSARAVESAAHKILAGAAISARTRGTSISGFGSSRGRRLGGSGGSGAGGGSGGLSGSGLSGGGLVLAEATSKLRGAAALIVVESSGVGILAGASIQACSGPDSDALILILAILAAVASDGVAGTWIVAFNVVGRVRARLAVDARIDGALVVAVAFASQRVSGAARRERWCKACASQASVSPKKCGIRSGPVLIKASTTVAARAKRACYCRFPAVQVLIIQNATVFGLAFILKGTANNTSAKRGMNPGRKVLEGMRSFTTKIFAKKCSRSSDDLRIIESSWTTASRADSCLKGQGWNREDWSWDKLSINRTGVSVSRDSTNLKPLFVRIRAGSTFGTSNLFSDAFVLGKTIGDGF